MQQKAQSYIENHQLLTPGAKVIVGVSGGADSIALLHLLKRLGYSCIIAHCNFHLRMEESNRDEEFVRIISKEWNLPSYFIDFKTVEYASSHKISIEMAARELRYNWFEELRTNLNAEAVAVAHHADDNIETLLMNLVRGTGLRGLTGIPPRNGYVVRPLIGCSRIEIIRYISGNNLEFVEDSTNASSEYTRNKIRNELIPLLLEINPSVRQTLYETIERFNGIEDIYQQAINETESKIVHKTETSLKIEIKLLKKQIQQKTILFEILNPYGFNVSVIQNILDSLDKEPGQLFHTPDFCLLHDREYLILNSAHKHSNEYLIINKEDITNNSISGFHFCLYSKTDNFKLQKEKNRAYLDFSKLQFPLILRNWKTGDSFFPFGMKNRKKLSDFFVDEKLSRFEKNSCKLLTSGEEIVWIVGQRTDNRFRITELTSEILEITLTN